MRICHVVEAAGGGSGNVVTDLAAYSMQAGDDVTVVYAPARAWPGFVSALAAIPGLKTVTCPMRREVGLHDLADGHHLFTLLKQHGPFDIIHSHCSKAGALTRLAGPFLAGAQIYTPHGIFSMRPGTSPVYKWIEQILQFFCRRLIAVSPVEWRHIRSLGIPEKKAALIPVGTAPAPGLPRDQVRHEWNVGADDFVIGFVGRLTDPKNPMRALETFHKVCSRAPHARLVIIGDGPDQPSLETYIRLHGLEGKTTLVTKHHAARFMSGFDCLLCTSDAESFGLVLIEAMNAGIPVVTTPVGIAEKAVVPAETGFIGDFTPDSLAEAMLRLIALDPARRANMAAACRTMGRQFDVGTMGRQTRELYQAVLNEAQAAP